MADLDLHNRTPELQALAYARSAKDICWWFDQWVWTYDPRLTDIPYVPMVLFPRQRELLGWLEDLEAKSAIVSTDAIAEKSRDMGLTWLIVGFLVHRWLFRDGFKGSVGSRKLNLVDTLGDPDSIIEKARIILRNLPGWMVPAGWDDSKHDNWCKLINPLNGSTITGEAGDNIGRGGRSSFYFVDEAAFLERAQKVDASLSANTNLRLWGSTPNGTGNLFARKRHSGKCPVFTMRWTSDPRKNHWEIIDAAGDVVGSGPGGSDPPASVPPGCVLRYPWYEAEKERLSDPVVVAQELDIDYTASVEGIAIPAKWVRAAVDLAKRVLLPTGPTIAGLDVADGGDNKTVLTIRRGPVIGPILARKEGGTTDTAHWALDSSRSAGARQLNYDSVGVGAGVAGTFKTLARSQPLGLIVAGVNVGRSPTETVWPDGHTASEKFGNLKAELWWVVRRRFEKTYEFVELGIFHPLDELISIPDEPQLISQISNVKAFVTEIGKTVIETKKQLRLRGVPSPDYAESLMLCFAPAHKPVDVAVGGVREAVAQYKPR